MTPEGKIKLKVKKLLSRFKNYCFMPVQTGYGQRTIDFLICCKGRFIGIETKAPGKKPTRLQNDCMCKIEVAGGYCFVVDGDESLMEVEEFLKGL